MAALLPPSAPPRAFRHAVAHPPLAAAHARPVVTLAPGGASSRPSPWRGAAPSALLALRSGRGSPDEADRSGADWVTSLAGLTAPIRRPGLGTLHTRGAPRVRRYGILEGDKATQPTDERVEPLAEQKGRGNDQPCNITADHLRSYRRFQNRSPLGYPISVVSAASYRSGYPCPIVESQSFRSVSLTNT